VSSVIIFPQLQQDSTSWTLLALCRDVDGDDAGVLLATLRFEHALLVGGICAFPLTMMEMNNQKWKYLYAGDDNVMMTC